MIIFIIRGYGYNAHEACLETYGEAFATREEAEERFHEIVKEQAYFGSTEFGMTFHEVIRRKNGKLQEYALSQIYDVSKPEQKELFLYATTIVNANLEPEEFTPKADSPARAIRTMYIASIRIEEQELNIK